MIVLTSSLPSKGKLSDVKEIDLKPLTLKQIRQHSMHKYESDIDKLANDIEYLIRDIIGWKSLSAYDLSCILFTREYISATAKDTITITIGNEPYTLRIADITFKDVPDDLLKINTVQLGGNNYIIKVPTIYEYYRNLKSVQSFLKSGNIWLTKNDIMIMTALGMNETNFKQFYEMYSNLSENDLSMINYLDLLLNDSTNDVTVKGNGGETVVKINNFITDIFRFIIFNRPILFDKINYKQNI